MTGEGKGSVTCPSCGKEARGNFCHHCGASLGGRFCNQCGKELEAGARFCNQCGAGVGESKGGGAPPAKAGGASKGRSGSGGAPGRGRSRSSSSAPAAERAPTRRQVAVEAVGGSNLPWWIAGAALFGLILVVGWSMVRPAGPAAAAGGGAPAAAAGNPNAAGITDISQMTPREAADRLFDRVMRTISAGDTVGAMGFQPMAVQAYARAEPLDLDGVFHMALLELLADPQAALATSQRILEQEPTHILGLGVAARAALSAGDEEAATRYYQALLDSYDEEAARTLPAYEAHRNLLADYRTEAQAFLGAG